MEPHNLNTQIMYRKSLEICDTSQAVSAYFASEKTLLTLSRFAPLRQEIALSLVNDALLIPKSVSEIFNSKTKEHRLQQLSLINIMMKNLLSYCNGLEKDGVKEKEYLNLLRSEIISFKKAFKIWRKSLLSIK